MAEAVEEILDFMEEWAQVQNLKLKGGVIKKGGHVQDNTKLYAQFLGDCVPRFPNITPPTPADFAAALTATLDTAAEAEYTEYSFTIPTVASVAEFIPQSLLRLGVRISPLGDEIINDYGRHINIGDLETILLCEAHLYNEESVVDSKIVRKQITATAVKDFIRKEIHDRAGKHWQETRVAIAYSADFHTHPDVYLAAILKNFSFVGDPVLNLAVLKQWMWQTKRFFMGLPVSDPLMVNIYAAKGGGGKTQIIRKLSEPLEAYTADSTLDTILDSREHGLFTDRVIVFFDEMSLGKIEYGQIGPLMAGLKKLITEDKITQRNMRETTHSKKRRTFSPIATSNQPLMQLLPDDSGMRRFMELEMRAEPNTERIRKLRAMDATAIWRGIDEKLEHGYIVEGSEIHKKLKTHQAGLKHRSVIDDCLENIEDLPIYADSPEAAAFEGIKTAKEAEKKADELGLLHYKIYEYAKLLKEWTEDNLDRYLVKYIPGPTKLPQELKRRDFFVFDPDPKNARVFIKDSSNGGRL